MMILTFWERPKYDNDPDSWDGILEVRLKSVKQIPELLAAMPANCEMVSTEYSGNHTMRGIVEFLDEHTHENPVYSIYNVGPIV